MEPKTLIQLLNFSRTLIQDGEFHFLYYSKCPILPDEQTPYEYRIAMFERQLRENPPKSKDPEGTRKLILEYLEEEKRYGAFSDTEEYASFLEGHLVFQALPTQKNNLSFQHAYRMTQICRFENYPSFEHSRFFIAGRVCNIFSNGSNPLVGWMPQQFSNESEYGHFIRDNKQWKSEVNILTYLPPVNPIDEDAAEMQLSESDNGEDIYIITDQPFENAKAKIFVRLNDSLPEVFRVEYYSKSDSPNADEEGYWLRLIKLYRDFERVPGLNIMVPKVREHQEMRGKDGRIRIHKIITIKEMDFNLGLPQNYFDWNEDELNTDNGRRKHINATRMSITGVYIPQEEIK